MWRLMAVGALPRRQTRLRSGCAPTEQDVVMEDSQIVAALSRDLAQRIGPERFALWFGLQTRLCVDGPRLAVHTTNEFMRDWLRKNLGSVIKECWKSAAGSEGTVEFELETAAVEPVQEDLSPNVEHTANSGSVAQPQATGEVRGVAAARGDETEGTRSTASLAAFVVGPSNEYAFRAAELTARGRQQASPVLICGPTGVGKTHLLRASLRRWLAC